MAVLRVPTMACVVAIVALLMPLRIDGEERGAESLSADQVRLLIDQLNADTLARRAEAERALQELGPAILPHLPNPETLSTNAAEAVKRIRGLLEQQQARAALRPGRVTLNGRRSLAQVIAAIVSQTDNPVDASKLPAPLRERTLAIDFEQTPFWQAIRHLEEQAQVTVRPGEHRQMLELAIRTDVEPLPSTFAVVGPFRINVAGAKLRPDFINPERRILRLTLEVWSEPRLRPLFVHIADEDLAVSDGTLGPVDTTPLTFPPLSPQASRELPVDKLGPVRITHDVVLPRSDPDRRLSSVNLQGSCEVEVAAAAERFEFRYLTEPGPITRRHGGVSVTLEDVQQRGSDLHASLRITYDSGGPRFESHRAWVFHNAVWLTGSGHNQRLLPAEFGTINEGAGGATLRYRFADVSAVVDDVQLTYVAPTLIMRVPVKFSITDIPVDE